MLNYAYAVLIAQTQIRLIVEGYDPTIGIMHEKKALRGIQPWVRSRSHGADAASGRPAVLHLLDSVTFTGADFSIQHDGACAAGGAARIGALPTQQRLVHLL